MASFTATSLNATLKSVRDDPRLVLQYPDLSTKQVEFSKQMITLCHQTKENETGLELPFDPLAEILSTFGLKYEFNLNKSLPPRFDIKLMVFKKNPVQVFKKPSCANELLKPNLLPDTGVSVSANTKTVIASFTASSLNATLDFLKDDSRLMLQYPYMSIEQAEFVKLMITQHINLIDGTDTGSKVLYDPLAELLKIFSLKYLDRAAPIHFYMKETTNIKENKLKKLAPLVENVLEVFAKKSFLQIKHFITSSAACVVFEEVTPLQEQFLLRWKSFVNSETMKWFSEDVQGTLIEIKELVKFAERIFTVHTTLKKISDTRRDVCLKKKWVKHKHTDTIIPVNTKPVKSIPIVKLVSESDSEVNTSPMTIAKVKTKNTIHNKTSTPIDEVKKENTQEENENTAFLLENEQTVIKSIEKANKSDEVYGHTSLPIANEQSTNTPIEKVKSEVNKNLRIPTAEVIKTMAENEIIPISKVNTESVTELSRTPSYYMPIGEVPIGKVMLENTKDVNEHILVNRFPTSAVKENFKSISNTLLISMPVERNESEYCMKDFIAVRFTRTSSILSLPRKIRVLVNVINNIDESSAGVVLNGFREFISSPEKEILSFTNLTWEEMNFVLGWEDVIREDSIIKLFSVKGQMVLQELRNVIDSAKYKVVVASKTIVITNRTVTFEKVIKETANLVSKNALGQESNEIAESSAALVTAQATNQTALRINTENIKSRIVKDYSYNLSITDRYRAKDFLIKIKDLPHSWVLTTLNQILDFLKDDFQASLLLNDLSMVQTAFVTKLEKHLKLQNVIDSFKEDVRKVLEEIYHTIFQNKHQFALSNSVTKSKIYEHRNFTLMKIPPLPTQDEDIEFVDAKGIMLKKYERKNNSRKTSNHVNYSTETCTEESNIVKEDSTRIKTPDNLIVPDISNECNAPFRISKVSFVKPPTSQSRTRSDSPITIKAKSKLREGLSQPVVSERGHKMMQSMGWQGGVLGARANGLVEPLALPLIRQTRAGLGSNKPPPAGTDLSS